MLRYPFKCILTTHYYLIDDTIESYSVTLKNYVTNEIVEKMHFSPLEREKAIDCWEYLLKIYDVYTEGEQT